MNSQYLSSIMRSALVTVLLFANIMASAQTPIKAHSITFDGRGASGTLTGLSGLIDFDRSDLASSRFDVSVDMSTISTGNATKDKHAKGESWFDVDTYPRAAFTSTSIEAVGEEFRAEGDLVLHGISLPCVIDFSHSEQAGQEEFFGRLTIDRTAHGITGPFFGFTVGDDFAVDLLVVIDSSE